MPIRHRRRAGVATAASVHVTTSSDVVGLPAILGLGAALAATVTMMAFRGRETAEVS